MRGFSPVRRVEYGGLKPIGLAAIGLPSGPPPAANGLPCSLSSSELRTPAICYESANNRESGTHRAKDLLPQRAYRVLCLDQPPINRELPAPRNPNQINKTSARAFCLS